jgi:hypothetical protein
MFCWNGSTMLDRRPLRLFVVTASVKLSVLTPREQFLLGTAIWCSLPVLDYVYLCHSSAGYLD